MRRPHGPAHRKVRQKRRQPILGLHQIPGLQRHPTNLTNHTSEPPSPPTRKNQKKIRPIRQIRPSPPAPTLRLPQGRAWPPCHAFTLPQSKIQNPQSGLPPGPSANSATSAVNSVSPIRDPPCPRHRASAFSLSSSDPTSRPHASHSKRRRPRSRLRRRLRLQRAARHRPHRSSPPKRSVRSTQSVRSHSHLPPMRRPHGPAAEPPANFSAHNPTITTCASYACSPVSSYPCDLPTLSPADSERNVLRNPFPHPQVNPEFGSKG